MHLRRLFLTVPFVSFLYAHDNPTSVSIIESVTNKETGPRPTMEMVDETQSTEEMEDEEVKDHDDLMVLIDVDQGGYETSGGSNETSNNSQTVMESSDDETLMDGMDEVMEWLQGLMRDDNHGEDPKESYSGDDWNVEEEVETDEDQTSMNATRNEPDVIFIIAPQPPPPPSSFVTPPNGFSKVPDDAINSDSEPEEESDEVPDNDPTEFTPDIDDNDSEDDTPPQQQQRPSSPPSSPPPQFVSPPTENTQDETTIITPPTTPSEPTTQFPPSPPESPVNTPAPPPPESANDGNQDDLSPSILDQNNSNSETVTNNDNTSETNQTPSDPQAPTEPVDQEDFGYADESETSAEEPYEDDIALYDVSSDFDGPVIHLEPISGEKEDTEADSEVGKTKGGEKEGNAKRDESKGMDGYKWMITSNANALFPLWSNMATSLVATEISVWLVMTMVM